MEKYGRCGVLVLADPDHRRDHCDKYQGDGGEGIQTAVMVTASMGFMILHGAIPLFI
ncbi:hypothetical protein GCM10009083_10960 [Halopseudomonas pertucinogena]|uniref:Uncharacterized protein n=1 Tax=Halopseudomonas pertucinogena TaxID=86175 RepID=A0ABQ2CNQ9_9GAMM|nr:hypothetical protein GCM10009083_10960 [Halopseudomonas pertucinogena]